MSTECTIYVNTGTQDSALGTSGAEFTELDEINDSLIFSGGSDTVKDGEPIPSESQLNQAGLLLIEPRIEQTIEKYFLADSDANLLRQIHNMGAGNYRYNLAIDFSDSTVSEPTFEIYDDEDLDSIDNTALGAGTPSSSWYRGICTTDALPGVGWTGSRLAGSSDGHFLFLNNENGALSGAKTLYMNLKIVIPSIQINSLLTTPVFAVKYAQV